MSKTKIERRYDGGAVVRRYDGGAEWAKQRLREDMMEVEKIATYERELTTRMMILK